MNHQHSDITLQALLYAVKLITNQHIDPILHLGLRRDQIESLRSLTSEDLHHLSRETRVPVVTLQFDPDALDLAIARLDQRRADQALDHALIKAGARYEMMRELTGMSTDDYARLRRFLGVQDNKGRPHAPTDDQQQAVWEAWQATTEIGCLKRRYLEVHRRTGAPAGLIWRLTQEWQASPTLTLSAGPARPALII